MTSAAYSEFLESKRLRVLACGRDVAESEINARLFPFQRAIVRWAVRKGRCAIFADTGLGKTPMQLEWARLVGGRCLLSAAEVGAWHERERLWIVAYATGQQVGAPGQPRTNRSVESSTDVDRNGSDKRRTGSEVRQRLADAHRCARKASDSHSEPGAPGLDHDSIPGVQTDAGENGWWAAEPGVVRVVHGLSRRVDRVAALGNAQVCEVAREAWRRLSAAID